MAGTVEMAPEGCPGPEYIAHSKNYIDQLIENTSRKCWKRYLEDANQKNLAHSILSDYCQFENLRFKNSCFKSNLGLFHAVIKHGSSFDFLEISNQITWLKMLNQKCVELNNFGTKNLEKEVEKLIETNFESIISLSKQLGEHVYQLLTNPNSPVFLISNKSALLIFIKAFSSKPRYFMFVLADGNGPLDRFTLITAMKLRPNNFEKRIRVNKKMPKLWMNYKTLDIIFSPSIHFLNEPFVYVSLERNQFGNRF
ncbi:unnamed protein product [Caenorhabditis nigoni]